jgi:hypothetical protein
MAQYGSTGTVIPGSVHIVTGTVEAGTPTCGTGNACATVALSGSAAFTGSATFFCEGYDSTHFNSLNFLAAPTTGTSFTLQSKGAGAAANDVFVYRCTGY